MAYDAAPQPLGRAVWDAGARGSEFLTCFLLVVLALPHEDPRWGLDTRL